ERLWGRSVVSKVIFSSGHVTRCSSGMLLKSNTTSRPMTGEGYVSGGRKSSRHCRERTISQTVLIFRAHIGMISSCLSDIEMGSYMHEPTDQKQTHTLTH